MMQPKLKGPFNKINVDRPTATEDKTVLELQPVQIASSLNTMGHDDHYIASLVTSSSRNVRAGQAMGDKTRNRHAFYRIMEYKSAKQP